MSDKELKLGLLAEIARNDEMMPRRVAIPPDEMEKIREIMGVFGEYIEGHHHFDILVSSKFGVIRPDVDGGYKYFSSADGLFCGLVYEIYDDVRDLKLEGEHMDNSICKAEEEEIERRMRPYLEQLGEHYEEIFRAFLEKYSRSHSSTYSNISTFPHPADS